MNEKINNIYSWLKRKIESVFPKGHFARNVIILTGGAVVGQLITVIILPILTRLYSPEDFGVLGVYTSILGILTVVSSLRYELAIPLPKEDNVAKSLLVLCFAVLLGMTTAAWLLINLLKSAISDWSYLDSLKKFLWIIPLSMLGAGVYRTLRFWAIRMQDFLRISRTMIARGAVRAGIQLGLGLSASGPLGLLMGHFAGETAGSTSLGLSAFRKDKISMRDGISFKSIWNAGKRYRRFPIFSSGASLLNSLGVHLPQILLASLYGAQVAGWFALGQRVIVIPLNLVGDSIGQVYYGESANLARNRPDLLKRRFRRLTIRLGLMVGIPVVVICVLGQWFFPLAFGRDWAMAGRYLMILGVMFAARFCVVPMSQTLNILERQKIQLAWDGARLIIVIAALVVSKMLRLSHYQAIIVYSLSMTAAYIILWLLSWYALKHQSVIDEKVP